ncbi:MAG TPA: HD domain-containing protein [Propionibacteriaceae bacterium]
MVNHCLRSYVFAAAYGHAHHIAHDRELLFVSAMLHDLGLEEPFDNATESFEQASGHVAWVFGAGAGWDLDRRARASRAVVNHMRDDVDQTEDPEGHLLAKGTTLDISGGGALDWPPALRRETVRLLPRLDLASVFAQKLEEQARRKPHSSAGLAVRSGIADRLARNSLGLNQLEQSGSDVVKKPTR